MAKLSKIPKKSGKVAETKKTKKDKRLVKNEVDDDLGTSNKDNEIDLENNDDLLEKSGKLKNEKIEKQNVSLVTESDSDSQTSLEDTVKGKSWADLVEEKEKAIVAHVIKPEEKKRKAEDDVELLGKKPKIEFECTGEDIKAQFNRLDDNRSLRFRCLKTKSAQYIKELSPDILRVDFEEDVARTEVHKYGFIHFESESIAEKNLKILNGRSIYQLSVTYSNRKIFPLDKPEEMKRFHKPKLEFECADEEIMAQYNRLVEDDNRSLYFVCLNTMSEKDLYELSPDILHVTIRRRKLKTNLLKSNGQLYFETKSVAERNLKMLNDRSIHQLTVTYSDIKNGKMTGSMGNIKKRIMYALDKTKLVIKRCTPHTTNHDLRSAFPNCQKTTKKKNGRFVYFSSQADCKKAFDASSNLSINGVKVLVLYYQIPYASYVK